MRKEAIGADALPLQLGQMTEYLSRAFAPFVAERREIRISVIEPAPHPDLEAVLLIADQVDRHAYRQVAAHGRIERHQHALRGVCERRGSRNYAVDDRLAVLGLAGLKVRRVEAGFDEIALGVDPEQPWRLTADLPADDERGIEAHLAFLQVLTVAPLDITHRIRDQHRDIEHRPCTPQVLGRIADSAALVQYADNSLRSGEISGAQQHDNTIAAPLEHRHLAELGDVVETGIGAGVRGENHPLVEHHAYAVGHASRKPL